MSDRYLIAAGVLTHVSNMSSALNACAMACQSPGTAHNQLDSVVVPGDVVSMLGVTLRTASSFLLRTVSMVFVPMSLT